MSGKDVDCIIKESFYIPNYQLIMMTNETLSSWKVGQLRGIS